MTAGAVCILISISILAAISAGVASFEWQWAKLRTSNRSKRLARIKSSTLARDSESNPVLPVNISGVNTFGANAALRCKHNRFAWLLRRLAPAGRLKEHRFRQESVNSFEHDMPELLDVVALGMQAGMSFDSAFELYVSRFSTPLAQVCRESLETWKRGLLSREEGMQMLSQRIATPSFTRFCSVTIRAARFGAPITATLFDLAEEARKDYRAKQQEKVARAPVKMLIPTGTLILPAMLLLVMGPIVLDLIKRMV